MTDQSIYDALIPFVGHRIEVLCKDDATIIGDLHGIYMPQDLLLGFIALRNCILMRGNPLHLDRPGEADVMFCNIRSVTSYPRGRVL